MMTLVSSFHDPVFLAAPPLMDPPLEKTMRAVSGKKREPSEMDVALSLVEPTIVGERTCDFLRRLYPARTADNVAADLRAWRVKSGTIAKMLQMQSTPSTYLWIAMTCVYGPEFMCAVLETPPLWLSDAHLAARQADLSRRIDAIKLEVDSLK